MEQGLIAVDRWADGSQAYFLTHLHADHSSGLSPRWRRGPLFCSPVTARLLPAKFPGFDLSLLRVLKLGEPRSLSLTSPSDGHLVEIVVIAIDAHHCPGAVMFLFRGEFGCVLNTGDFRWELSSERAQLAKKMLFDALQGSSVDFLYMDNTYCHPRFSFPPREVAAKQIADIILQHPNHEIVIGIDNLGKEDLLLHISKVINTKIWVWPERLQTMDLLGYENIFTTSTSVTRVRAVPRYSLTFETLNALNKMHPTIGIMPSGLPWAIELSDRNVGLGGVSVSKCLQCKSNTRSEMQLQGNQICHTKRLHQYAYAVPYSDHSCFPEIEEFIRSVRPSNLSGIVSSSLCYINPCYFFNNLHGPSHPSSQRFQTMNSENSENAEDISICKCNCSMLKVRKAHKSKMYRFSIRRSRVSMMRRQQIGVKIVVADDTS